MLFLQFCTFAPVLGSHNVRRVRIVQNWLCSRETLCGDRRKQLFSVPLSERTRRSLGKEAFCRDRQIKLVTSQRGQHAKEEMSAGGGGATECNFCWKCGTETEST